MFHIQLQTGRDKYSSVAAKKEGVARGASHAVAQASDAGSMLHSATLTHITLQDRNKVILGRNRGSLVTPSPHNDHTIQSLRYNAMNLQRHWLYRYLRRQYKH